MTELNTSGTRDNPTEAPIPASEGWYWAKFDDYWEIAYWRSEEFWERTGIDGSVQFNLLKELGPQVFKPIYLCKEGEAQ